MSTIQLSVDEIVQTLRRSQLPTVLVEGRDDMTAYRWIEDRLGFWNANVLPCGGRSHLLEVFTRRHEYPSVATAFLADRDMWLFTAIPTEYNDIVFTTGYSIENDLLDSSPVHDLLSTSERQEFDSIADLLSRWFAFEVECYRAGTTCCCALRVNRLVPFGHTELDVSAVAPRQFREPDTALVTSIRAEFTLKFRGKSLLDLYVRLLADQNRTSQFSRFNLLEIGARLDGSPHIADLHVLVEQKLTRAQNN